MMNISLFLTACVLSTLTMFNNAHAQIQKISSELHVRLDRAEPHEYIRAVVTMVDQVPIDQLISSPKGKSKHEARRLIREQLNQFVLSSQHAVLDMLAAAESMGEVKSSRTLRSVNKIIIEAKKSLFYRLAERADVRDLYYEMPAMVLCTNTWNVEKINAHKVWSDIGITGEGVIVGVIDTGTDYNHTDLHSSIWQNLGEDDDSDGRTLELRSGQWVLDPDDLNGIDDDQNGYVDDLIGYDFVSDDFDPMDEHGHGTHVSGTVAGDGSGDTLTGVAPDAKLMVLRVANSDGYSVPSDAISAIEYGADNEADILNISLGWVYNLHYSPGGPSDPRADLRQSCDIANAMGIVICVSAGNYGEYANQLFWDEYWETYRDIRVPHNINTPGDVPSVITVGATDSVDMIADFSSRGPVTWSGVSGYNDFTYPPGHLKPDVSTPGVNVNSTVGGGGYSGNTWSGTSMSTPAVSGTVALMLQAYPQMSPTQVKDQLQKMAIDLGPSGKDSLYGSGRIEAFQSALNAVAHANKSIAGGATWYSNNHTLERGLHGKLHEVFHSGGEIFYRRSNDNGNTWETTARLSPGNGNNQVPSVAVGYGYPSDDLRVVWQRKLDNYHYEIWYGYSTNGGTTWSAPAYVQSSSYVSVSYPQSNQSGGPGPTPVVGSFFRGGCEGSPSYLLAYASLDGIHYRVAYEGATTWSVPGSDIIPGTYDPEEYSSIWHPSIATYNAQDYTVRLIYDDRYDHVYSNVFNAEESPTWGNRVQADWTGTYNRYSSLAIDYADSRFGVWSGWNSGLGRYTLRFRQGWANGTWSNWFKEWAAPAGVNLFYPCVTYYYKSGDAYPNRLDIVASSGDNGVYQVKYLGLGDNWSSLTQIASNVAGLNLSHERQGSGTPKQVWASLGSFPYPLTINSQGIPKEVQLASVGRTGIQYRRGVEIADPNSSSFLRIELSRPMIRSASDGVIEAPFKEFDYGGKTELSFSNLFDHLQAEKISIPADVEELEITFYIIADAPDTLRGGKLNAQKRTVFEKVSVTLNCLESSTGNLLSGVSVLSAVNSEGLHRVERTVKIPMGSFIGKELSFVPGVSLAGPFETEDLLFSLVNMEILHAEPAPKLANGVLAHKNLVLSQNYPNPFNPVTTIYFEVKQSGHVTLSVYDVLGREIAKLIDGVLEEGNHSVEFNASLLASGIYFYKLQAPGVSVVKKMVLAR